MLVHVKLLLTALLWGGTFIAGRLLAGEAAPGQAACLRFVIAALFLVPVCLRLDGRLALPSRRAWPVVVLLAATGVFAYNLCFFVGLRTVPASRAALIVAMNPVLVTLLSAWLFRDKPTPRRLLGTLLCVTGAATVIAKGQPAQLLAGGVGFGELAILGCTASWAVYTVAGKTVMRELSAAASVTWSSGLGALMLLPVALTESAAPDLSWTAWACVAYLGVGGTGLGFLWFYQGVRALGPSRASVYVNFVPACSILLAALFLGERPDASLLAGGALVCGGAWLVNGSAPAPSAATSARRIPRPRRTDTART